MTWEHATIVFSLPIAVFAIGYALGRIHRLWKDRHP